MNLFTCPVCKNQIYFENHECTECNAPLGFQYEEQQLVALQDQGDGKWGAVGAPPSQGAYRYCKNHELNSCNWLVSVDEPAEYCLSCRLTTDLPDLSVAENKTAWSALERAKRRLVYGLRSLGLPIESHAERENGLRFRLLRGTEEAPVMTGHDFGTITINIAEADDSYREQQRNLMGEAYRTPLGHFRHEIGHYYFDRLVLDTDHIDAFRQLFGDERVSYEASLTRHYEQGPPADYAQNFISSYATMHPWEDWAETWAHYMHMVDTLETGQSYGLAVSRPADDVQVDMQGVDLKNFQALFKAWIPITLAVNGLNRSMGLADAYPFAISPKVQEKLAFIHKIVHSPAPALKHVHRQAGASARIHPLPKSNQSLPDGATVAHA